MKELFERHRSRLTDAENRRVWETMFDATQARSRSRWWIPTTATAGVLAVIAVALIGPDVFWNQTTDVMVEPDLNAALEKSAPPEAASPLAELNEVLVKESGTESEDGDVTALGDVARAADEIEAAPSRTEVVGEVNAKVTGAERADLAQGESGSDGDETPARASAERRTAETQSEPTGVIRGRVTSSDGKPLPFANVVLGRTDVITTTDREGNFELTGVPAGVDTLSVLYLGFATVDWGFTMRGDELMAELVMEPAPLVATTFGNTVDTFAEAVKLKKDAVAAGGQLHFRGGRAGEVQFQIDGIRVDDPLPGAKPQGESGAASPAESEKSRSDDKNETWGGVAPQTRDRSETAQRENRKAPMTDGYTSGSGEDKDGRVASKGKIEGDAIKQSVQEEQFSAFAPPVDNLTLRPKRPAVPPIAAPPDATHPISVGGTDPVNGAAYDAMFFEHYGVNPFIDPRDDKFATFAVDVDNASFTLARSYLKDGNLPPKEAIRVEEFVNAFDHRYPAPGSPLTASRRPVSSKNGTFAIYLDATPSPFGPNKHLLRVGLKGREINTENRKPATLTFLVDVSGSMGRENRLGLVKQALGLLLDQMRSDDAVGLVVYGSNARVVLPHTSLRDRWRIEQAIQNLHPEGATNAEAGLLEAYRLADRSFESDRINRVVLCSDGVANVGNTGADAILARIKAEARRGIELTAVGFGMGNYNDVLMEKLANQGDGNYFYVDQIEEARKMFVENLTGTLQTIAKDMKIQVEFDPKTVRSYRLLGYENRDVADKDFRNDAVDTGEVGAGHEVTALFELNLEDGRKRGDLATVRIRYADAESGRVFEEARSIRRRDIRKSWNDADPTFRMDAAIAECAEILRHSYWAKESDLGAVVGLAHAAAWEMGRPDDAMDVVDLIERAARLWPADTPTGWRGDPLPNEDDR